MNAMSIEAMKQALEYVHQQGWSEERDSTIDALKAAIADVEKTEPVAWRYRTRPDWQDAWTPWMYCTKGRFEDYKKTPKLHDWYFEAQEIYTLKEPT